MEFFIYLPADDITGESWGTIPPALRLARQWHKANVLAGGPEAAEVQASGPEPMLWEMLEWLRRPMEIFNEHGEIVWWGMVNEIRVTVGVLTISTSLDRIANKVAVTYSYTKPNGTTVQGTTSYASHTLSLLRYGTKDLLESLGESEESAALARRTTLLAEKALPVRSPSFGAPSSQLAAAGLLLGVGWYETLKWQKFQRLEGRIEFEGSSDGSNQAIGWGITASNRIGFGFGGIHDMDARLGALVAGSRVVATGASVSGNNRIYTVATGTTDEQTTYTSASVYFESDDDILDSLAGMGFVRSETFIQVSGSPSNSRYHLIDDAGSDHLTTFGTTGLIVDEVSGPAITILQGHSVDVAEGSSKEIPGTGTVTLRQYGYELAQSFVASHAMVVDKIGIPVGKVGNPTDNFTVLLRADSGGNPGSTLVSGTAAGADILETGDWFWIDVANTATLTLGATYWIHAYRSGSLDPVNYFTVQMTEEASGSCLAWTGSAWTAHGEYMPFRVWGAEETTAQLRRIFSDAGQFFTAIDIQTNSNRYTNQYRDNDLSAFDEAEKLLKEGTSDGRRLLVTVTPERVVQVMAKPAMPDQGLDQYHLDGTIRTAGGGRRMGGMLPAGEWLEVAGVPTSLVPPVFVAIAECNEDGQYYTITPEDLAD